MADEIKYPATIPYKFCIENKTDEIQENRIILNLMDLFEDNKRETTSGHSDTTYKEVLADLFQQKIFCVALTVLIITGEENFTKEITIRSKRGNGLWSVMPFTIKVKENAINKSIAKYIVEENRGYCLADIFTLSIDKVMPHTKIELWLFAPDKTPTQIS